MARAGAIAPLLAAALAAQSSCGGASHERPPPAAGARVGTPAAPGPATRAVAGVPAQRPARALHVPADGWSEHDAGESAMRSALEQRFPLHGVAFHMQAQVFSEPAEGSQVIGYLRRGTRFRAAARGRAGGCERGWHELSSGGFVCEGRGFALGATPQSFEPSPRSAALHDPLPYAYAKNVARLSLQYFRIPDTREEREAERLLAEAPADFLRTPAQGSEARPAGSEPNPPEPRFALPDYARMPMEPGFYVSVDRTVLADDAGAQLALDGECPAQDPVEDCSAAAASARAFVRTVRGAFVTSDALAPVSAPPAPGTALGDALELPLGIVYRGSARRLLRDTASGALQEGERLARFAHVALSGARVRHEGQDFLQARSGELVSELHLRVAQRTARPALVPRHARWIHVRLAEQTLVAYEGDRPVFATLVATGKEGFETPQGLFRVHGKHVSATMDGLAGSDEVYSIEDVPWTMYFQGSYALHAAFWHDKLGAVRSHGCVNLAPEDARWLFRWTTPALPSGFHGVIATSDNPGTFVFID
jgi:hypothetical protein